MQFKLKKPVLIGCNRFRSRFFDFGVSGNRLRLPVAYFWGKKPDWTGPVYTIYVPLHVDDGLAITNSQLLYAWFLAMLAKRLNVVKLGHCSKFLSVLILWDRPNCRLWLSSHIYVSELLSEWNLSSCKPALVPFPSHIMDLSPAPLNSLPDISDADLTPRYQRLVGCLLYLAVTTRPDIVYYSMWLGQFNAKPSRAHFLAAKHVLRYLSGTKDLGLCLGSPSSRVPSTLRGYLQSVGCSDADWASDAVDRKSISGYSFYFEGSLISWSAVKTEINSLVFDRSWILCDDTCIQGGPLAPRFPSPFEISCSSTFPYPERQPSSLFTIQFPCNIGPF